MRILSKLLVNRVAAINQLTNSIKHFESLDRFTNYSDYNSKLETIKANTASLKPSISESVPTSPFTMSNEQSDKLYRSLSTILWLLKANDENSLPVAYSLFDHLNTSGFTKNINNDIHDASSSNDLRFIISNYSCLIALHYGKGDLALDFSSLLFSSSSSTTYKNDLLNAIINHFIIDGDRASVSLLIKHLSSMSHHIPTTHLHALFNLLVEFGDSNSLYRLYLAVKDYFVPPESSLLCISTHFSSNNMSSNHKALVMTLIQSSHFSSMSPSSQSAILINCCRLNQPDIIKQTYHHLPLANLSPSHTSNLTLSIIRLLTKNSNNTDNIKFANEVFESYLKDSKPSDYDHVQLNALSRMCLYLGNSTASLTVFRHLLSRSVMPDLKDINLSLLAIAQTSPQQAYQLFNHAIERGLQPTSESYGTLVNQLLKSQSYDVIDELLADMDERRIDKLPLMEIIIQYHLITDRPYTHLLSQLDKSHRHRPSKSIVYKCIDHSLSKEAAHSSQLKYELSLAVKYNYLTTRKRHSVVLHLLETKDLLNKSNLYNRHLLNVVESLFTRKLPNESLEHMLVFIAIFSEYNNRLALLDCLRRVDDGGAVKFEQLTALLSEKQISISANATSRLATIFDQHKHRASNQSKGTRI